MCVNSVLHASSLPPIILNPLVITINLSCVPEDPLNWEDTTAPGKKRWQVLRQTVLKKRVGIPLLITHILKPGLPEVYLKREWQAGRSLIT